MKLKSQVYYSDDYAGCENGKHSFYFGYEKTFCKLHGKDSDCECENKEDCFVVDVDSKEVMRLTRTEIEKLVSYASPELSEPPQYLLAGIMEYLKTI
jgi:hypothetical protein